MIASGRLDSRVVSHSTLNIGSVTRYLAILHHFGKILKIFGNFLKVTFLPTLENSVCFWANLGC